MDEIKLISRPPTGREIFIDRAFRRLSYTFAMLTVLLVVAIVVEIGGDALPTIRKLGVNFLTEKTWDPHQEVYGIRPHIWGTLYSSVLALVIGTVFGVAVAIFLSERFLSTFIFAILRRFGLQFHPFWGKLPDRMELLLKNLIELSGGDSQCGLRTVGIFVVIPLLVPVCKVCTTSWAGFRSSARR